MCASFIDDTVLCEKCEENYQSEQFVSRQSEDLERKESTVQVDREEEQPAFRPPARKINPAAVQISIIGLCLVILAGRLLFFSGSGSNATSSEQDLVTQQMTSLAQCLIVFRQIGVELAETGTAPTLTCPDAAGPNRIQQTNGDTVVSHPAPQLYGFSSIEVSRLDPEPRLVE
jgi:hypothetical protein